MKRNLLILLTVIFCVACMSLAACSPEIQTYTVTFESGGGQGTAPVVEPKKAGEKFAMPDNTFKYEGYDFAGWKTGDKTYQPQDTFTMPESNVVFTAQWVKKAVPAAPSFSQPSYSYDRLGGGALELPFALNGYNLIYIEIDGVRLPANVFFYNDQTQCIEIDAEYILAYADGTYEIMAFTDAEIYESATCTLEVYNSLETSFDPVTEKDFTFGVDKSVEFNVDFKTATVSELRQGDRVIESQYYNLQDNIFSVSADWLRHYYGKTEFTLVLSNNDRYSFSINSNVIFYTDYDVTTIHSDIQSNIGHNPLYQYTDNVSIVDAPENSQMQGKVLQFTPNTEDVTYSCNGIYTTRIPSSGMMWYDPGFAAGKYYAISFDYMTENTTVGEFSYKSVSGLWSDDLLLGAENDGKVHHYSKIVSYEELGEGVMLWAFFKGGSGKVYTDNMTIVELDGKPTVAAKTDWGMTGDCTIDFEPAGHLWTLECNGVEVSSDNYTQENGVLVMKESFMADLGVGTHTFTVVYPFAEQQFAVRIYDSTAADFVTKEAEYKHEVTGDIKMYGTFAEDLEIVSFKQMPKSYDSGYGGWEFVATDFNREYKEEVTLVTGIDDKGYLLLPETFLDKFYGTTVFEIEFSNGRVEEITITSNALMLDNKDESSLSGVLNGTPDLGSPLNSGFRGGEVEVRDDGTGNNALYVKSTAGAGEKNLYTVKLHDHVWAWYHVPGREGYLYRVKFDYQLTGIAEKEAYFFLLHDGNEDLASNFFGSGYETAANRDGEEIRWYMNADGQRHTLDTGWFTWKEVIRLMRIVLPSFTAEEGKEVMIDNFAVYETKDPLYGIQYNEEDGQLTIPLGGYKFEKLFINGEEVAVEETNGNIVVSADAMNKFPYGKISVTVQTASGNFKGELRKVGSGVAELTETSKTVNHNDESCKLAGTFTDSLTVVSLTRQGTNFWDTSKTTPTPMNTSYITVESDGLVLSKELIEQAYGTMKYNVVLSNGIELSFTLESNVLHYTNYDETYVHEESQGNVKYCQDTSMAEKVEYNGGHAIKYTPANATLPHSTAANNGSGSDNGIFTFSNLSLGNAWWWEYNFDTASKYEVFFDYEIVGEKPSAYIFQWIDTDGTMHDVALNGKDTFSIQLDASQFVGFRICCPVATPDGNSDTYMIIDNFGFAKVTE